MKGQETVPIRKAEAAWHGTFADGEGKMRLGSGAFEGAYSYRSRMEEGPGTNPEELLGAAHAGYPTTGVHYDALPKNHAA